MPGPNSDPCDVLVIGDEIESILTAVSCARQGVNVVLARQSQGDFGGLSVRGGLSYMDITPEYANGLFGDFLKQAGVVRVALNPEAAHHVLQYWLQETKITVISGVIPEVRLNDTGAIETVQLMPIPENRTDSIVEPIFLTPHVLIDATPDGDVMRALGVPFVVGLGGLLGDEQNFLGVSPVFRISGVPTEALQEFEAQLRQNPELPKRLQDALPYHAPELLAEYLVRPTDAPPHMDYLDILNPVIGIDYHHWRHGQTANYAHSDVFIDGANISRLNDGSLGFNGLVFQAQALDLDLDDLLAMSRGGPIPGLMLEEMRQFERYLQTQAQLSRAVITPPEELYVRQTVTLLAKRNMTARIALEGGFSSDRAINTFSYWLDLRGTQLWKKYPGLTLPKPVFNMSLDVTLPLEPALRNIAFVGRSAGYSPLGQGAGRIVQHNSLLGESLGIAAALAIQSQTTLDEVIESQLDTIRAIWEKRWGKPVPRDGENRLTPELANSQLLADDEAIMTRLRESATDFGLL